MLRATVAGVVPRTSAIALGTAVLLWSGWSRAGDDLAIVETRLDRSTVVTLGVQVLVSGDDDRDATITPRFREAGAATWRNGPPLWHVRPSVVVGRTVPEQFAGSLFDLRPSTDYEIELDATDPDGLTATLTLTGKTRPVPRAEPTTPRAVPVATTAELEAALSTAASGDVITLAAGTYVGQFVVDASGTDDEPVVMRGAGDATILDGGDCPDCNVLEVYGSHVHIERLTIRSAQRALRFQGQGAVGNVVRRVHIEDVRLGIGGKEDQQDFYICDNDIAGRLSWPAVYGDDDGAHSNDDGIQVFGSGHVVCHNRLVGFGDAIKMGQDGSRSVDIYGNETLSAYDNAVEFDASEGNVRCFRNRLLNSWSPLSFQPIFGGPAYAFRNVVVNVVDEQMKLHSLGGTTETVGAIVLHNTFVSAAHAVQLQATATAHDFWMENNLFVGPSTPTDGKTINWSVPIDNGVIDFNGYFPDGSFDFDAAGQWASFAEMKGAGTFEMHGVLLDDKTFSSGLGAPTSYTDVVTSPDATLNPGSPAVDAAEVLPNWNDGFTGAAPDLGALEIGCPLPMYGVRPEGMDETNEPTGCAESPVIDGGIPAVDGGGTAADASSGAGGSPAGSGGASGNAGATASAGTSAGGAGMGTPEAGPGASDAGDSSAADGDGGDGAGCACRTERRGGSVSWWWVALAAVLLCAARRRSSQ